MSENAEKKELIRGMKHLLINKLLRYGLRVFRPVAMKKGVDIAICDVVGENFRCVAAQIRASSLHLRKGKKRSWEYQFNIPMRNEFIDSPNFFHLLCLEDVDELRPIYLVIPNSALKKLAEAKMDSPTSWRAKRNYGCHLSRSQLFVLGWIDYRNRFDLIDKALGIETREPRVRKSDEYWKSDMYKPEQELCQDNIEK